VERFRSILAVLGLLCGVAGWAPSVQAVDAPGLEAFWQEASRTVAQGDFAGYAATYHEDAVLVSLASGKSVPIATALAGWKQGFDDTKDGKAKAGVEFRFTRQLVSETTAHLTGIFHYTFEPAGGQRDDSYVHFEALLVKKPAGWKMIMEHQKNAATPEEWNAAGS
jgi:ketosteroid isomerase-like protein